MIGTLYLIFFITIAQLTANRVFRDEALHYRVWAGGIVGIMGTIWTVVPFAFIFGFNTLSHFLAAAFSLVLYLWYAKKTPKPQAFHVSELKSLLLPMGMILPITTLIGILLHTHVLLPGSNGELFGGQSTYGDLAMHLSMISSIATQQSFPPEYSIFTGTKLSYPFLVNSLSSTFYLFGSSLRYAVLIPSLVITFYLVFGFYFLVYHLLRRHLASYIASLLFFFNGGFGFIYFMDGLRKNSENFTRIFSEWYHTPTNYNEHFIRWSNVISDMIVPQRTTLIGWTIALFLFWLALRAIEKKSKLYLLVLGILTGLMPMIHTHSFLAFGIIALVWFLVELFNEKERLDYIKKWLYFGVPVALLALPQLFFWTFSQATGDSFTRFHFDWANEGDIWLWFYIKNIGIVFILALPAFLSVSKRLQKIYLGPIVLFLIADFIVFQPNLYDNNKLFYMWYVFTVILVVAFLIQMHTLLKPLRGRYLLLAFVIFAGTFSGILTYGREVKSQYQLFSLADIKAAEYVKENIPADALFLTATNHLNTISVLTGRDIYCGAVIHVFFHGLDFHKRDKEIRTMYTNKGQFAKLANEKKIDYVYLSVYERKKYGVRAAYFKDYPKVYDANGISIFAVSKRAILDASSSTKREKL